MNAVERMDKLFHETGMRWLCSPTCCTASSPDGLTTYRLTLQGNKWEGHCVRAGELQRFELGSLSDCIGEINRREKTR